MVKEDKVQGLELEIRGTLFPEKNLFAELRTL